VNKGEQEEERIVKKGFISGALLVLVGWLLWAGIAGASLAAQVPEYELQANPTFSTSGDAYIDTDELVDAAGNRYVALAEAQPGNGNNTFVTLRKITPNGVVLELGRFYPTGNQKIDKAVLSRSGRSLIVSGITHEIVGTKPRVLERQDFAVDVGFITTTTFLLEEGGPGAFVGMSQVPTPTPVPVVCPPPVPVDYAQIRQIMREEIGRALTAYGPTVQARAYAAVEGAYNFGRGSHIVYGQSLNIAYKANSDFATVVAATATAVARSSPTPRP
jgi:hypothetical protein